ncbi:MAG: DEAD/DEAH box helicase [Nannocystaceae bacterium]|nr:DEAD/DEAH box helicase [Nannocystaceae bacterium]
MRLRPYQRDAVAAVVATRRAGVRRMVVALPTGAGKTVVFAELIRRARNPVVVLAHREELVSQARDKIQAALGRDPQDERIVAIEQGASRAPAEASVLVASIRSLHEGRIGQVLGGRDIRLVIYDECHHAVADANRRVLEQIGAFEPDWPGTLVGFTATTRRADGRGLDVVFETIAYSLSLREMIDSGYLRPLEGLRIDTGVDLSGVTVRGEDFDELELAEKIDVRARNLLVARAIQECARDRRTIAFCVGVAHAFNLRDALRSIGVPTGMVSGETPKPERTETLRRFRDGELRVITNVGVLTEGFDDPGVSAIAMVRPTRSESMYLQCVGRGMRLSPDAAACLVLDFVDLSSLDIITAPTLDAGPSRAEVEEPEQEEAVVGSAMHDVAQHDEMPATLAEIEARLAVFDPLTLEQREEAAAISLNAWLSLGAQGMMLHFQDRRGELQCFELRAEGRRGASVWLAGKKLARLPSMNEAIEAVDLELPRHGDANSGRSHAAWRRAAVPKSLQAALLALKPPRVADNVGVAIAHLALAHALRGVSA